MEGPLARRLWRRVCANRLTPPGSARLDPAAWVHAQCPWWKGMFTLAAGGRSLAAGRGPAIFARCEWGEQQCGRTERCFNGDPGQPVADRP